MAEELIFGMTPQEYFEMSQPVEYDPNQSDDDPYSEDWHDWRVRNGR